MREARSAWKGDLRRLMVCRCLLPLSLHPLLCAPLVFYRLTDGCGQCAEYTDNSLGGSDSEGELMVSDRQRRAIEAIKDDEAANGLIAKLRQQTADNAVRNEEEVISKFYELKLQLTLLFLNQRGT